MTDSHATRTLRRYPLAAILKPTSSWVRDSYGEGGAGWANMVRY